LSSPWKSGLAAALSVHGSPPPLSGRNLVDAPRADQALIAPRIRADSYNFGVSTLRSVGQGLWVEIGALIR
jgi:hypothetical protein